MAYFLHIQEDWSNQELPQMSAAEDRRDRVISFGLPVMVVLTGCGASLLPSAVLSHILEFLTVWTFLSIPLAVLVGHCALGED